MINKYLKTELNNNKTSHEIFEKQEHSDLADIQKELESQTETTDILIEFTPKMKDKVLLIYRFLYGSNENKKLWEHFVALEIMKKLKTEYKIEIDHDLEEEEKYICTNNLEYYLAVEEVLIDKKDVIETLRNLNLPNLRLHFLIRWCKSHSLCDAVSDYLADNLPFITMIYHDVAFYTCQVQPEGYSSKQHMWSVYDYKNFSEFNEGIDSSKIRIKKILPDKTKQKVKKYEEV